MLRDSKGIWLCKFTSYDTGGYTFLAEAVALRDGLLMAWWARKVCYEVDCKDLALMVSMMKIGSECIPKC